MAAVNDAPSGARKLVYGLLAGFLAIIFLTSFIKRMDAPDPRRAQVPVDDHDHGDDPKTAKPGAGPPPGMGAGAGGAGGMGAMTGMGKMPADMGKLMMQLKERPNDPDLLADLGEKMMEMGNWEAAENFLSKARVAKPADVKVLDLLAMSFVQREKWPEAVKLYEEIAKVEPSNTPAWYNLGVINKHHLGDKEKAKQYLQKAADTPFEDPELNKKAREELQGL